MDFISALIYGVVQGITEFLPVSSSGHLAILPSVLKIKDPGVAFDLSMHVGTAFAVVIYYFKDIKNLFLSLVKDFQNALLAKGLIISTIASVLLILVLKNYSTQARLTNIISLNLIIFGILMFLSDHFCKNNNVFSSKNYIIFSIVIGFSQSLAIFPGVSRSGVTLTASRFLGLSRLEATKFSFLMSLPIIIAGFIYKLPSLSSQAEISIYVCLFGIVISFLVGLMTIHYFTKFIKKMGLWVFALYRIILGSILLIF